MLLLLAACTKKTETAENSAAPGAPTTVALVKAQEQSRHFVAVAIRN